MTKNFQVFKESAFEIPINYRVFNEIKSVCQECKPYGNSNPVLSEIVNQIERLIPNEPSENKTDLTQRKSDITICQQQLAMDLQTLNRLGGDLLSSCKFDL